ncbi:MULTISPECIES: type III secretion system needle filament subunit SctF [Chromobacterium]|jgi:type III secretion protein F|uniref:EscF/YscF/HrpA family type III secretion system needle major subunit n=2 Tax=Chromobacterium TaxID=535 RepID=A0A1S1WX66_9NEIS|nr:MULTISPECIES: type III secretion system needle filament subunit SctF [Chromobacterium]KIA79931.1 type III secretion system needle protein SsaG [Chromobacterium piscinae]MBM2883583.1 type III secretion system needle filament subunit SctF [Chromobacterium amazonense]MDE1715376.1 type III secretion system needle filament subunit SctF [Chromobacterium amazonense]MDQ4541163.1 type III secretion system needle filament subunit SctF [Chromobacterium amazonense]OHX11795.1 EscF/YscF/HrpA family type 
MNIDSLVAQMGSQVTRSANDAEAAMNANVQNDPQAMLKSQYALQQYSVMIGYESSVMKAVKDMMMGIISKIG